MQSRIAVRSRDSRPELDNGIFLHDPQMRTVESARWSAQLRESAGLSEHPIPLQLHAVVSQIWSRLPVLLHESSSALPAIIVIKEEGTNLDHVGNAEQHAGKIVSAV